MKINSLEFENFRNLDKNKIFPSESTNVIYGENAQGKTNLLECMWLFCGGHSFRGANEREFIKFGEKFSKIRLEFESTDRTQNAEIRYKGRNKEVFINGVKKKSGAELIEKFSCVVFSPEHLSLVKAGPGLRRKFLDGALCQQRLRYAMYFAKYNKVLNQRNALLKDINRNTSLADTLSVWDEHLSFLGAYLVQQRVKYVEKLQNLAIGFHSGISNNKEKLDIEYVSTISDYDVENTADIQEKFISRLQEKQRDDLYLGYTTVGPHRDDINILINGMKAKSFGSQGQQRSAVLSLKLAEAEALTSIREEKPVLLFDDVLSELDNKRQEYLLNKITDYQVFITCCENIDSRNLNGKLFEVKSGRVQEKDVPSFG
ncbi:MAG: DNA replication/repair protein RecF [Ruminococcus sp.]|nr:DNA replication/repair protein RecF [Ruminococcus sp.]